MGNIIGFVTDNWVAITAISGLVLGVWHAIVKLTPTTADDAIEAKVESVLAGFGIKPTVAGK